MWGRGWVLICKTKKLFLIRCADNHPIFRFLALFFQRAKTSLFLGILCFVFSFFFLLFSFFIFFFFLFATPERLKTVLLKSWFI